MRKGLGFLSVRVFYREREREKNKSATTEEETHLYGKLCCANTSYSSRYNNDERSMPGVHHDDDDEQQQHERKL